MPHLQTLSTDISQEFLKTYGRAPRWIVAAPGRVNLIGEHIDYNDGFVLPMAIDRYAVMAADRSVDGESMIQIRDVSGAEPALINLCVPIVPAPPKWGNYSRGVIAGCLAYGMNPGGLDVILHSNVPLGSGLSSSAALEVCTATLFEAATRKKMEPVEKALLCQKAEHDFANVPCGIMDQFISVMGRQDHLLLIDCRSLKTKLVPMTDTSVSLLIINTNVKHDLSSGGYARQRIRCESAAKLFGVPALRDVTPTKLEKTKDKLDEPMFRCVRHAITEIERTLQAAKEIANSSWPAVGQLMYASHRSLRNDYEVSCVELDTVVEIAEDLGVERGVYGCRMTGGGFGGCAIALVKTEMTETITDQIAANYKAKTGIEATIFTSRPAEGARVLKA